MALLPQGKFGQDVLWNMGAFAVQGVCGLALNVLIGRFYGPASLGLFNQVFALYILFSQFAVFGLHYSALVHVAQSRETAAVAQAVAVSAVLLTMATATVTVLAAFVGAPLLARAFSSQEFEAAWLTALPGLWCFALNKTLLAILNGQGRMQAFAVAQAGRYLLLLAALGLWIARGLPAGLVAGILSAAELALTLGLLVSMAGLSDWSRPTGLGAWSRRHLQFGARSFLSGAVIELNSRVDVILLGCYLDEAAIGIYSLAAMFVEGAAQAFVVLRNVVNPLITRHVAKGEFAQLVALRRRLSRWIWMLSIPAGIVAVAAYAELLPLLVGDAAFAASVPVFAILVAGLVVSAGYQPFALALVQGGWPGLQTVCMGLVLAVNVLGNALFIPVWGIVGAAMATSVSFVAAVPILRYLFIKRTGFAL